MIGFVTVINMVSRLEHVVFSARWSSGIRSRLGSIGEDCGLDICSFQPSPSSSLPLPNKKLEYPDEGVSV